MVLRQGLVCGKINHKKSKWIDKDRGWNRDERGCQKGR
jgi:hypothetical protein